MSRTWIVNGHKIVTIGVAPRAALDLFYYVGLTQSLLGS